MNEIDKPRGDRRRSSRGRRRRSGGADRSAQDAPARPLEAEAPARKPAPRQEQTPKAPPAAGQSRQQRSGRQNERSQRSKEKSARQGERPKGEQPKALPRRGGQGDSGRAAAPAPAKERIPAPRIVPPTLPKPICPRCGMPIEDLPSALNEKESGTPIHFDCALARLSEAENLGEGEKIVYLGGGRFGVVQFENPGDLKKFRIRKTLQWEDKEKRSDWRQQVTDLYSST